MATAIIEVDVGIPGATGLTLDLSAHESDIIAVASLALVEETNRKGVFRTTTAAGLTGLYRASIKSGTTEIGRGYVYMSDTPDVHTVYGSRLDAVSKIDANVVSLAGDNGAAERLAKSADTICFGTVATGATVSVVPTAAFDPNSAALEADQFRGRVLIFRSSTGTAKLKGQGSIIDSNTGGATPSFTLSDPLTETPAAGDVFVIV